ncbi:lipopolysaccharide-induced tumor necrosis factor-alpha factor homolog isoform 1-T1 [Cochliomyia hominivorax]
MTTPMGPESQQAYCPNCKLNVSTNIELKASNKTHILALLLCLCGCCPCAGCLYCTACARNVEHYCPTCNTFLGVYER